MKPLTFIIPCSITRVGKYNLKAQTAIYKFQPGPGPGAGKDKYP